MSNQANANLERISAFLQCVGLPKDYADAVAGATREGAVSLPGDARGEEAASSAALERIMGEYQDWLGHLCEVAGRGDGACPALLGSHLRPVLHQYPEIFLRCENLPPEVYAAIEKAENPLVPEEAPADMPTQPLDESALDFHANFWSRIAAGFRLGKAWLLRRGRDGRWLP